MRHVCVAYRRYLEAHLYRKAELIKRAQLRPAEKLSVPLMPSLPPYKVMLYLWCSFSVLN